MAGLALIGVVVPTVVEGFGEVEVDVGVIVVVGKGGGWVHVDFNDAVIDSILFSKVAPNRCSKAWRSKFVEGVLEVGSTWPGVDVFLEVSTEGVEVSDVLGTVGTCPWATGWHYLRYLGSSM